MKRTPTKQSKVLQFVARCQFKAYPHAIVYAFQSDAKRYHVTILDGRVSGCCQPNGDPCKGWSYTHKCHHAERALALECERAEQLAEAATIAMSTLPEMAAHQDVEAHVEDSIRSGELSWAEQQRQARAEMTADEQREQLLALGDRRWMAA